MFVQKGSLCAGSLAWGNLRIAVFRKYYAENNKAGASDVSAAELDGAKALAGKYFAAGVNSVPFIIEADKLK